MFEDCFLTLSEKVILFSFQIKSRRKSKFKRSVSNDSLLFEYRFLEEYFPDGKTSVIRLSDKGRKYIRYRREKRFDQLIIPVIVSVAASLITSALTTWLINNLL